MHLNCDSSRLGQKFSYSTEANVVDLSHSWINAIFAKVGDRNVKIGLIIVGVFLDPCTCKQLEQVSMSEDGVRKRCYLEERDDALRNSKIIERF